MAGARPRDSSSMMSRRGLATNAMPRPSCCCSPPDRFPAIWCQRSLRRGNNSRTRSVRAWTSAASSLAKSHAADFEVLDDGQRGEHRSAPGHLDDPQPGALDRIGMGDVSTVELDRALDGIHQAGDRLQQGGLPGPVGAEEGDDLALADLHVHPEQHPHLVVGDLDAPAHEERTTQCGWPGRRHRSRPGDRGRRWAGGEKGRRGDIDGRRRRRRARQDRLRQSRVVASGVTPMADVEDEPQHHDDQPQRDDDGHDEAAAP